MLASWHSYINDDCRDRAELDKNTYISFSGIETYAMLVMDDSQYLHTAMIYALFMIGHHSITDDSICTTMQILVFTRNSKRIEKQKVFKNEIRA